MANYNLLTKKCLKYMNKLSILKGGNGYKLPCEINNITKNILYNYRYIAQTALNKDNSLRTAYDDFLNLLPNKIDTRIDYYMQDPYIILKDHTCKDNYVYTSDKITSIFAGYYHDDGDYNIITKLENENGANFGGNFISDPFNNIYYFNVNHINTDLIDKYIKPSSNNLIGLSCSFLYEGIRHIDECLTFMPYGPGKFKIWVYDIREEYIHLNPSTAYEFKLLNKKELVAYLHKAVVNNEYGTVANATKEEGLKFIEWLVSVGDDYIPQTPIFAYAKERFENLIKFCDGKIKSVKESYRNIANTVLNYFRKPTPDTNFFNIFKSEQLDNLNKISFALYGKPYDKDTCDNFVLFPITLKQAGTDWKISLPPIFNRLWLEYENEVICVLSKQHEPTVIAIFNKERDAIQSMRAPSKKINYIFLDTSIFNNIGSGGNLHCLFKQLF